MEVWESHVFVYRCETHKFERSSIVWWVERVMWAKNHRFSDCICSDCGVNQSNIRASMDSPGYIYFVLITFQRKYWRCRQGQGFTQCAIRTYRRRHEEMTSWPLLGLSISVVLPLTVSLDRQMSILGHWLIILINLIDQLRNCTPWLV